MHSIWDSNMWEYVPKKDESLKMDEKTAILILILMNLKMNSLHNFSNLAKQRFFGERKSAKDNAIKVYLTPDSSHIEQTTITCITKFIVHCYDSNCAMNPFKGIFTATRSQQRDSRLAIL